MSPVIEIVNVTREASWLPWAVQYFFLIGLSVGCFALTLPGFAFGHAAWLRAARLALVGALVCGLAAPVALLADLHQPGRFWRFYAHPNAASWMAWGAFFLPAYLLALLGYAWTALRPALGTARCRNARLAAAWRRAAWPGRPLAGPATLRLLAALAGAAALLVLLYTGMEVMVVRARPLWHTPFLPVQFALTALASAIGLVLVLDRLFPPRDPVMAARLAFHLAKLQVVALGLGATWLVVGLFGDDPVHRAAIAAIAGSAAWQLTAGWFVLVALLTAALSFGPSGYVWIAGLLGLHAAWVFRWAVFIGVQAVPKTGAGLYATALPAGPEGLLGILGTAGLCLALLIAVTALLPWEEAGPAPEWLRGRGTVPGRASP